MSVAMFKACRGARGMGWRAALAVSPVINDKGVTKGVYVSHSLKDISKTTGIDVKTLRNMLLPGGDLNKFTISQPDKGWAEMINVYDIDGPNAAIKLNSGFKLSNVFQFAKKGLYQYFPMATRKRNCPLNPAENWFYWWLRSRIRAGKSPVDFGEASRLSKVPEPKVREALKTLGDLKWIVRGEGKKLALGDVDVSEFFVTKAGGAASKQSLWDALPEVTPVAQPEQILSKPDTTKFDDDFMSELLGDVESKA